MESRAGPRAPRPAAPPLPPPVALLPPAPAVPPRPWWLTLHRRPSIHVALAFLGAKLAATLLAFALLDETAAGFLRHLSLAWDGIHYLAIAREGHAMDRIPELGNPFAFPPLFPWLIRLFGSGDLAPLWANNLASLGAVVAVSELLGARAGLFLALFPLWVGYSTVGYSEGTFVLVAALALLTLRRSAAAAGALTGLAALARYVAGGTLALAGAWWLWRRRPALALYLGLVAAAGAGILLWHSLAGGSPTVYLQAQEAWGARLAWPWEQWDWYLNGWFTNQDVVRRNAHPSLFLLRNLLLSLPTLYGVALLWLRREWRPLALFSTGIVVVTFCTVGTPALSTPRLLLSAFPALAVVGTRIRGRAAWAACACLGVVGGAWVLVQHLTSFFL